MSEPGDPNSPGSASTASSSGLSSSSGSSGWSDELNEPSELDGLGFGVLLAVRGLRDQMTQKLFQVIEWCFSPLFDAAEMSETMRSAITKIRELSPVVVRCARQCRAQDWYPTSDEVETMDNFICAINAVTENMYVEFTEPGRICINVNTIPTFCGFAPGHDDPEIESGLSRMHEGYTHFLLDEVQKFFVSKQAEEWFVSPLEEASLRPPADIASRPFDWARFNDIVHGRQPHSVNVPFQEEVFDGVYTCQDGPLHRSEQHPDGTCDIYYRYPPHSLPHVLEMADRVLGRHAGSALLLTAAWEENPWEREPV